MRLKVLIVPQSDIDMPYVIFDQVRTDPEEIGEEGKLWLERRSSLPYPQEGLLDNVVREIRIAQPEKRMLEQYGLILLKQRLERLLVGRLDASEESSIRLLDGIHALYA